MQLEHAIDHNVRCILINHALSTMHGDGSPCKFRLQLWAYLGLFRLINSYMFYIIWCSCIYALIYIHTLCYIKTKSKTTNQSLKTKQFPLLMAIKSILGGYLNKILHPLHGSIFAIINKKIKNKHFRVSYNLWKIMDTLCDRNKYNILLLTLDHYT